MASAMTLVYRGDRIRSHEMGAMGPSAPDKAPLLIRQVAEKAIDEAPKEATTKTCEMVYLATDLFSVPRMVVGVQNAVLGKPDAAGMHGLGLTSIFSVYTGAVAGQRGYKEYTESSKIDDTTGKVMGAVNMARAPMEIMGGLTFTPFRALSIAAMYTSSKVVIAAQFIFGILGSAFFAVTYALLAIPSAISLYKNTRFSSKLDSAMNEGKTRYSKVKYGLLALKNEYKGTEEEKRAFLGKVAESSKVAKGKKAKPIDESLLTSSEKMFLLNEARKHAPLDPFKANDLYGHFKEQFVKFKAKKEVQFARKTGPETAAWMKEELAKPVEEQLFYQVEWGNGLDKAEGVLGRIKNEMLKNRILHVAIIVFCMIGVAALIAGTIYTGGAIGIAIAVAWVVASVGMLAIDAYFLYKALQQGEMDKKDKIAFFVANALLILVAGAGVFFSGGIAPLVIGSVMLVLWSGVAGYSYFKWREKKEEVIEEPPHRGFSSVPIPKKRHFS